MYLCNVQRFRDLFYKALYKFIIIIIISRLHGDPTAFLPRVHGGYKKWSNFQKFNFKKDDVKETSFTKPRDNIVRIIEISDNLHLAISKLIIRREIQSLRQLQFDNKVQGIVIDAVRDTNMPRPHYQNGKMFSDLIAFSTRPSRFCHDLNVFATRVLCLYYVQGDDMMLVFRPLRLDCALTAFL